MRSMYFFMSFLFFQQMIYALKSPNVPVLGKYQILPTDMTGTCSFEYLMNSATYIDMSGIDHRFPYIENDTSIVGHFAALFKKKKILEYLQNENESMINKQLTWDEYTKNYTDSNYAMNVFAGGLMVDWDADIE